MKLVRFDGGHTGLLVGDVVVDVAASLSALTQEEAHVLKPLVPAGASWAGLIEHWSAARGPLARLEELEATHEGEGHGLALRPAGDGHLEPPLPEPATRIFAMGGNFPMHTAQTADKLEIELSDEVKSQEKDAPPWGFYVIPGTTVGPDVAVSPPAGTQKFDYEAEVGVVLDGAGGIWGYTAWNDFSMRDAAFGMRTVDHGPLTWSLQKNFATANAAGPCLVVDEGTDYAEMRIVCAVNGETRQDGNTREMKYSYEEIAAHIAEYLPLRPGDMILSGTPGGTAMEGGPDGHFLQDGDVCEVTVGDAPVLRNRVVIS